ncbi:MAG: hypothetical protein CHACPFDD_01884 [Phycisphaerae bacterium]|nr:hypothetical protein [Phycisphaerae bacterium]
MLRADWARMLGADAESLRAGNAVSGDVTQSVMYDGATDSYKFTLVYYRQFVGDVPVHGRELRVLTRNVEGFPVVWARSSLTDLGDFTLDPNATPLSRAQLEGYVRALRPNMTTFCAPRQVVWAGTEEEPAPPRLAFELDVDNLGRADRRAADEAWSFMLDAFSGDVLRLDNRILHATLTGTVKAYATVDYRAGECADEVLTALPYATVDVDVQDVLRVADRQVGAVVLDVDGRAVDDVAANLVAPGDVAFFAVGLGDFRVAKVI